MSYKPIIAHGLFSKNYAETNSASIAKQPNGNYVFITHWPSTVNVANKIKKTHPDIVYIGEVYQDWDNLLTTKDLITDPNEQMEIHLENMKKAKTTLKNLKGVKK